MKRGKREGRGEVEDNAHREDHRVSLSRGMRGSIDMSMA